MDVARKLRTKPGGSVAVVDVPTGVEVGQGGSPVALRLRPGSR